jgi:alpha-beta hydrolase superfamily lysophospholipase
MQKLEYDDYWFNYVFKTDPQEIKNAVKEEYITSQGLKIHLDIYDKEEPLDNTVIFIPGTAMYSRFYAEFCYNLFQKGFRVVIPDMRGHGLSEGTRGHFTMEEFTKNTYDVTSHVLDTFGGKVAIMGSSLGGITTLYSAANDDERLSAAICHNAALFDEKAYKRIVPIKGILKILLPLVPITAKIAPRARVSVWLYLKAERLAKSEEMLGKLDILKKDKLLSHKYSIKAIRAQQKDPMAKKIEDISTPVMIINGDEDILFSVEYMTELYDRLTCVHKNLEIIEGASHLIFQENVEASLNRIVPWLNKVLQ